MRFFFLTPLLMLGVIGYAFWYKYDFPLPSFLFPKVEVLPTPSPRVGAALSIPEPLVNPVLHIDVPQKSLFAPQ